MLAQLSSLPFTPILLPLAHDKRRWSVSNEKRPPNATFTVAVKSSEAA